jgi:hypothetical protein
VRTFTLTINLENDAFSPEPEPEVARILRVIADKLEENPGYPMYQTVFDVNGNDVGRFRLPADWNSDG